jgi:hypothetical protein
VIDKEGKKKNQGEKLLFSQEDNKMLGKTQDLTKTFCNKY